MATRVEKTTLNDEIQRAHVPEQSRLLLYICLIPHPIRYGHRHQDARATIFAGACQRIHRDESGRVRQKSVLHRDLTNLLWQIVALFVNCAISKIGQLLPCPDRG